MLTVTREHLGDPSIDIATDLVKSGIADSLDIVELTMALEAEFQLEIDDTEMERLRSVEDFAHCICTKL